MQISGYSSKELVVFNYMYRVDYLCTIHANCMPEQWPIGALVAKVSQALASAELFRPADGDSDVAPSLDRLFAARLTNE